MISPILGGYPGAEVRRRHRRTGVVELAALKSSSAGDVEWNGVRPVRGRVLGRIVLKIGHGGRESVMGSGLGR
jgi:hypothetical protein